MIGFMLSDWPCTYLFLVVDSIMSQTTNAMGFYTGYFCHMTKHACMPREYPCWFVLSDDQLSIFDYQQSILSHSIVYISSQHPGMSSPANQISRSKYSAHGYQEGLPSF